MAPTPNEDIFQSSFTWNLSRDLFSFSSSLVKTEQISIQGLPFKWQLAMTKKSMLNNSNAIIPSICFNLDFIGDGLTPEKYTKITSDFEMGSYWSGKADLFPTNVRQTAWVKQSTLRKNISREGTLVIGCRMTVTAYFRESKPSELTIDHPRSCVMKLFKDIGVLLENGKLSDVKIVVNGQELKAHQFILGARSPVFSLMLATDMKEKIERRIEIPDVSTEAVKEFLKFLYTAKVPTTPHSKDLLSLAALYQIEDLKEICGQMLTTQLSKDNALEYLFLANLHNCEDLQKKAFEIITQQILDETIPDHLMDKPAAIEKLVIAKLKYNEVLQEVKNM